MLQRIFLETSTDRKAFDHFADNLIRSDGVVVLRLLTRNAGDIIGSSVVATLWNMSRDEMEKRVKQGYHPNEFSHDETYPGYRH